MTVQHKVQAVFNSYTELERTGDAYGAWTELAAIFALLPTMDDEERAQWSERLRDLTLTPSSADAIRRGLATDKSRLAQVLAFGTTWLFEEYLQLVTLRIQIESTCELLAVFQDQNMDIDMHQIDERIKDSLEIEENRYNFEASLRAIQKNHWLPSQSRFLADVLGH